MGHRLDLVNETVVPGSLRAWAVAMRPRTLWIAAVPVGVGTSIAWMEGAGVPTWVAALAFAGSILMQVIANLQNDVGYTARGLETGSRVGLPRATARGWLTAAEVRRSIAACIALAVAAGLPLVAHAGPVVLAIGAASILAGISYMGGPKPIAYSPFGEMVVFLFFGLVAVMGTHFLYGGPSSACAWLAAAAVGCHAAAVLAVNNHRDAEHDARTGRRTFAATFGRRASAALFGALLWTPFVLVFALVLAAGPVLALPVVLLPAAWWLQRAFTRAPGGVAFNRILLQTVLLELAFGALLCAGAIAQRLLAAA